ncbi:hypothetical protein F2P79_008245 [Pimephales promelas]|nr:hypothetical protein F2P79_008245 [Pimephales promelas]
MTTYSRIIESGIIINKLNDKLKRKTHFPPKRPLNRRKNVRRKLSTDVHQGQDVEDEMCAHVICEEAVNFALRMFNSERSM